MALVQLAGQVPRGTVDHATALDGRTLGNLVRPAQNVGIRLNLQKFTGFVQLALGKRAVPRPDRHVGNGVLIPRQVGTFRKALVKDIKLALDLHRVPIDRIFDLGRCVSVEMTEPAAKKGRTAHLPEQPRQACGAKRAECLSWLSWQMGSAPFLGGGFGHFYAYAPTKIEYAIDRYAMEVKRQLDVLDQRLAKSPYLAGDEYTIADMAVWPWYGTLVKGKLYEAGEFLQVQQYHNVQRWTDQIAQRPAVQRGRMVNRTSGEPANQLHERHDAGDFDTKTQDKLIQS